MQISHDLQWLQAAGVGVERFNLAQEPDAFVRNQRVTGLMSAFGDGALPAVLVNDRVYAHGRYPSREELAAAVRDEAADTGEARVSSDTDTSGGCEPGFSCC